MLKTRIITACILVVVLLLAFYFLSPPQLAVVFVVVMAIASFEWATISAVKSLIAKVVYVILVLSVFALLAYQFGLPAEFDSPIIQYMVQLSCVLWVLAFVLIKTYPESGKLWHGLVARLLIGLLVIVPAWVSLVFLLFAEAGQWLLLLLLSIVALADTGAYFTGKAFGKHKLAPTVSPGKTWEGVFGGLFVVIVLTLVLSFVLPVNLVSQPMFVVMLVLPAMFSVVGDLFESMFKRSSGIKDSGTILPGHGGMLDRIDGLVAALPVFVMVYSSFGVRF